MKYIVIEIQRTIGNTTTAINTIHSDPNIANQDFFTKCSYAAVSGLPRHTIVLLNEGGTELKCETFTTEPEYE